MPGKLQPLSDKFKIVKPDGTPTLYFTQWAQQRQLDISAGISSEQAIELIRDWAASRQIFTNFGLSGGGPLSNDVTLNLDAVLDDLNDVDAPAPADSDVLTWSQALGMWVPAPASGGGGGSVAIWDKVSPPLAASFTSFFGTPTPTLTDGTDAMLVNYGPLAGGNTMSGALMPLPVSPTADYTVYCRLIWSQLTLNNLINGICLRDSITGRQLVFGVGNSSRIVMYTGINATYNGTGAIDMGSVGNQPPQWLRIRHVSNVCFLEYAFDAQSWISIGSLADATWMTNHPDQIGIGSLRSNGDTSRVMRSAIPYFGMSPP